MVRYSKQVVLLIVSEFLIITKNYTDMVKLRELSVNLVLFSMPVGIHGYVCNLICNICVV